ncbi:MAG TPA: class I SAM-dependent methyltransferase [Vicinamibacterales bacterium]|nr:class I SAM-dependent methyltransferase [Vicinamibacterales bacterium]
MRVVDDRAIRSHASVRFRSEYHYAVFEYWRSAKVLGYLERAGVRSLGRVLDDGCGGGGMGVSFAEEARDVVAIDPADRFRDAGVRLAEEKGVRNVRFARADGTRLPFQSGSFDLVLSHAVIEHVGDPAAYLHEARRVLKPGGLLFLQTAPYLSPHGAHLPRLKIPVPFYLFVGRRAAFAASCWMARHRPGWLDVDREGSSFVTLVEKGEKKTDDLLYRVTVRNLRRHIADAGFRQMREDLYVSRLATRLLARPVSSLVPQVPLVRDVLVTNMEYLLAT